MLSADNSAESVLEVSIHLFSRAGFRVANFEMLPQLLLLITWVFLFFNKFEWKALKKSNAQFFIEVVFFEWFIEDRTQKILTKKAAL